MFTPFVIPKDEIFWKEEEWDEFVPKGGFIEDFVTALRGVATPTSICLWSAIGLISASSGRSVYMEWYPEPLLANMYIIVVAPPKMCAKSTGINFGARIMKLLPDYYRSVGDEGRAMKKHIRTSSSRATPEGIITALVPEEYTYEQNGVIYSGSTGSQLAFVVSELSTFLTKTQYNIGLISKLTDLYDGKVSDDDITAGQKRRFLKDIYVTLLAGTTPDDLKDVIPEEAFGGGFMSRCIIAMQKEIVRPYPKPRKVIDKAELQLAERLAYVLKKSEGEYTLSKEAEDYYEKWFLKWSKTVGNTSSIKVRDLLLRSDTNLLKLSLLLTVQNYEVSHQISLETLKQAERLLNKTIESSIVALNAIGESFYHSRLSLLKELFKKKRKIARRTLLQYVSAYQVNAELMSKLLDQLAQEEFITIRKDGRIHTVASSTSTELYLWTGKED